MLLDNELVYKPMLIFSAVACKEKALFLLKFAGLTKVQLKNEVILGNVLLFSWSPEFEMELFM